MEKSERAAFLKRFENELKKYFDSKLYLYVSGAVILASALFSLEIFAFFYVVANLFLICFFTDDAKPITMLLISVSFCISAARVPTGSNPDAASRGFLTSPATVAVIVVLAIISFACFVYFIVKNRLFKKIFLSEGKLTLGLIFFSLGLILNGFGFETFRLKNLALGALEAVSFFFVYAFFLAAVKDDGESDSFEYYSHAATVTLLVVLVQISVVFISAATSADAVSKNAIYLGWGNSNNIGSIFVAAMPSAAYLGFKEKRGFLYFLICALAIVGTFFSLSRASLISVLVSFAAIVVFVIAKSNDKKRVITYFAVIALLAGLTVLLFKLFLPNAFKFFSDTKLDDRGRFPLYKEGFENFLRSPSFGVGLTYIAPDSQSGINFFFGLVTYHNTIIQMLAACGIFGLSGYIVMRAQTIKLFIQRPTDKRFFMAVAVAAILFNSLLDNHLFYFYPAFFYSLNLVFAEKDLTTTLSLTSEPSQSS